MTTGSTAEVQVTRRSWVVLLYFFAAALIGLGFVVTGASLALFGVKDALFPSLGLPRYSYEVYGYEAYPAPVGPSKTEVQEPERKTEAEIAREQREAKARAIDERRSNGVDRMLSGLIIAGVGAPVLVWHLKRGRALSAGAADAAPSSADVAAGGTKAEPSP
jgi:hypothetical protein